MRKAFTLVELLIVIAILAVLSVVVFVVINPGQRIADAQNATVRNDAQTVQKAFELYAVDNGGSFPDTDDGDDLITHFSNSSLPSATCTEDIHGSTVTAADLTDFITEDNDFVPEYLSEESANSLTNAKVFYYSPAQQVVVCNPLADDTAYNYPEVSGGSNLVTNGTFDSASGWTAPAGWSIGGGVAHAATTGSGIYLTRSIPIIQGKSYIATYTISNYVSGNFRIVVGSGGNGSTRSTNGTYSETITAGVNTTLYIVAYANTTADIDNIVVTEVP